jgi:glycosyltransferase involved in cell wall biosynthesis
MRVHTVTTWGIDSKSLSAVTYGISASLHAASERPGVALVMNVANGLFLPALASRGIPTLVNVDGIEWEREKWGRLARSTFIMGARMTAKLGTQLVFDAEEVRRLWNTRFSRDGVHIPYGGDSREDLGAPLGLESKSYVLMVARLVPENTVGPFLEAVRAFANQVPVVIVGSTGYGGDLDRSVERLAASHSRVRWLGHLADDDLLHALWQHAGVYFHGHSVGGTNPALVQAMALGAPTVARDTPYNRETLGTDGVFTSNDPAEIGEAIHRVLTDRALNRTLAGSARRRARERFQWVDVCNAYEIALESLRLGNQGDRRG